MSVKSIQNLEFNKVIVFSTGHITPEDNARLKSMVDDNSQFVFDHEYGYMIWAEPPNEIDKMSTEFKHLNELAIVHGCQWVRLDRDGPVYAELPAFEW